MEERIRNLKRLARSIRYNERKDLERYTRKLFRYRQKDRKPKKSKIGKVPV